MKLKRRSFFRRLTRSPVPVHQGFWRLRIGPLPVSYEDDIYDRQFSTKPHTAPAPEIVNALIKDYVCPGMQESFEIEHHYMFKTRIPTTEDNQYDNTITITLLADNYYENWWALHRYMDTVMNFTRNGHPVENINHRVYGIDGWYRNRLTFIPYIDMHAADDCAQEHMIVRFERCRIESLGDLQIKPGSIDPISFNLTIKYELRRIIRLPDPNDLMSAICVSTSTDAYN